MDDPSLGRLGTPYHFGTIQTKKAIIDGFIKVS